MLTTRETGIRGEEIATLYLQNLGYEIRERNVRFGKFELDIIAYDSSEKMMVFVEVKARKTHSEQYPIHTAIDGRKRRALRKAIAHWANKHHYEGPGRTDVISVAGITVVEHIQNIGSDFF